MADAPLRSASVAQVNDQRRKAVRTAGLPFNPRILIVILAVVAVVAVGVFAVAQTSMFKVEKVTVSGVEHLTAEEMTSLAAVPQDTTLLRVDAGRIEGNLASNAWVKSAHVERVFPDTLNLAIEERTISAVVEMKVDDSANSETWALSSDGMWLMKIPDANSPEGKTVASKVYEDAEQALRITDVPYGSRPEAGSMCNNANIENALGVIDGMSTELADQIKYVAASNSESTTLTLENGVEVAFGDSSNIREKERVVLQLLEEHKGKIAYVNVRNVKSPIWRSL